MGCGVRDQKCDQNSGFRDRMLYIAMKKHGIRKQPETDSVVFAPKHSSLVLHCFLILKV